MPRIQRVAVALSAKKYKENLCFVSSNSLNCHKHRKYCIHTISMYNRRYMNTDSIKRVNITLPARTLREIDKVAERGDRSRFINLAVNFYVQEIGRKNLRVALKEGAIRRSERDRDISTEWFKLDEEVWQGSAR